MLGTSLQRDNYLTSAVKWAKTKFFMKGIVLIMADLTFQWASFILNRPFF